jgi:hypothetical protein
MPFDYYRAYAIFRTAPDQKELLLDIGVGLKVLGVESPDPPLVGWLSNVSDPEVYPDGRGARGHLQEKKGGVFDLETPDKLRYRFVPISLQLLKKLVSEGRWKWHGEPPDLKDDAEVNRYFVEDTLDEKEWPPPEKISAS